MKTKLTNDVYLVGVKDWNRRLFDALIPLPQGTSYNSYLVRGMSKTALIDTVNPGFETQFLDNIAQIMDVKDIDYLIMNHAEPDHAGAIPFIMDRSKAILVTTEKGAKMAKLQFNVTDARIKVVKDKDTLSLEGKTLQFFEAPWLHWPETMFTYLIEDKILFPCDFFGSHTAFGIYDTDVEDLLPNAQRYFGEIMMPFRAMGKKALEKLKNYDVQIIAPSHGPIYKNPKKIMHAYEDWTSGKTKEKAILIYATMWKSTEKMMTAMAETLMINAIDVKIYNLANADIGDIAKDLVDSRAIVLGSPTVLGSLHPLAVYAVHLAKVLNPPLKYGVFLGSYGWGGAGAKYVVDALGTKLEIVGACEINGPPTAADMHTVVGIGITLADKIKNEKMPGY